MKEEMIIRDGREHGPPVGIGRSDFSPSERRAPRLSGVNEAKQQAVQRLLRELLENAIAMR
jgi:hypothetical protein